MFDMVDIAFSYGRALIICYFFQESFKVNESSLHEIWNADTAFVLNWGRDMVYTGENVNLITYLKLLHNSPYLNDTNEIF